MDVTESLSNFDQHYGGDNNNDIFSQQAQMLRKIVPQALHPRLLAGATSKATALPVLINKEDEGEEAVVDRRRLAHQVIGQMNNDTFGALMDMMGFSSSSSSSSSYEEVDYADNERNHRVEEEEQEMDWFNEEIMEIEEEEW